MSYVVAGGLIPETDSTAARAVTYPVVFGVEKCPPHCARATGPPDVQRTSPTARGRRPDASFLEPEAAGRSDGRHETPCRAQGCRRSSHSRSGRRHEAPLGSDSRRAKFKHFRDAQVPDPNRTIRPLRNADRTNEAQIARRRPHLGQHDLEGIVALDGRWHRVGMEEHQPDANDGRPSGYCHRSQYGAALVRPALPRKS